ncbi:histidinol dehydrogenase [Roseovarius salis]|uniref:histidinol dehydrogenase n=1 Tax=Roseovarius salis TaxID=3376063 RepID=UPI0037C72FE4
MSVTVLKAATPRAPSETADLRDMVSVILANIASHGEDEVRRYAETLDRWTGPVLLDAQARQAAAARVPAGLKESIAFAHSNIRRFAEAQRATLTDCTVELFPGHWAGQKSIPVSSAGCYVPGGRYSHIASALMTITTAKAAGVPHIVAASPPRDGKGIPDAIVYAMDLAGADHILNLGGVQAIAAMAEGLFGLRPADILVGPGNAFVAEAKRQLFGQVGIDMFAGPTDTLVIADKTADPETVAWDLVGQAEHGPDSPVWLVTDHRPLAEAVMDAAPRLAAELPEPNGPAAVAAWDAMAEVTLCDTREEMAEVADRYAPEHLHVQAAELDWWLGRLSVYGSLFLGADTTVPFGDKASGPNHVLPTSGAARYTGGLSVHKFLKTVTWQRGSEEARDRLARVTADICRHEGMEGHARSAELRRDQAPAAVQPAHGKGA